MASRKKIASIAFTGAAATIAVGAGALPAHAAPVWTIKNAAAKYKGVVKGKNTTGITSLKSSGKTALTCPRSDAKVSGSVPNSSVAGKPAVVARVKKTGTAFKSCTAPGNIAFTAVLSASASLQASSYVGPAATGVTTGKLLNIHAKITGSSLNSCAAKVSGKLPVSFLNSKHEIVVDKAASSGLKVVSAKGCGGLTTGKKAYFKAIYVVSAPAALTISS
jgi:hypothetical protein